jgi:non-ribosomal peptide synthetase component F
LCRWTWDGAAAQSLAQIGRMQSASFFTTRLAAFLAVLSAATGQSDIVIGTYMANRTHPELQKMFGLFANLVPLRFVYDPARTFSEWLATVRDRLADTTTHAVIPHEEIGRELRTLGLTMPEIRLIVLSTTTGPPIRFAGLTLSHTSTAVKSMPWGFTLNLGGDDVRSLATFDAHIYDPSGVRSLIDQYRQFLGAVARHPDTPMADLPT